MDKISVIIPTYNRANLIERAVGSVLRQTYDNLEIILVDDGSQDNTEAVVKAIGDGRIVYKKLKDNHGAAYARNAGVEYAEGRVIAFQDSDDAWRPQKLEKQMAYWKEHQEFSMIYCPYEVHMNNSEGRYPAEDADMLEGDLFHALLVRNTIGTPAMLMTRESFLETGGFDVTMKSLEDWDFAIRFSQRNLIGYLDEVLVDAYYERDEEPAGFSGYFETRLRMIARYRQQLTEDGSLDAALMKVFQRAERVGVLDQVQKLSLLLLGGIG